MSPILVRLSNMALIAPPSKMTAVDLLRKAGVPAAHKFSNGAVTWYHTSDTVRSLTKEDWAALFALWKTHAPVVSKTFDWYSIYNSTPSPRPGLYWRYLSTYIALACVVSHPKYQDFLKAIGNCRSKLNSLLPNYAWNREGMGDLDEWWALSYLSGTISIESRGNPFSRYAYGSNKVNSTAVGIGQVTNSTAKYVVKQYTNTDKELQWIADTTGTVPNPTSVEDSLVKHRGSKMSAAPGLLTQESLMLDSAKILFTNLDKFSVLVNKLKTTVYDLQPLCSYCETILKGKVDNFDIMLAMARYAYYAGLKEFPSLTAPVRREINFIFNRAYTALADAAPFDGISYPKQP